MEKLRDLLKNIYLFQGFSDEDLALIARIARRHDFSAGQRVFYEGDEASSFFVVELGTIQMTKKNEEGDHEEIVVIGNGAHFGELPFLDEARRDLTAVARERCDLYEISYTELREVLHNNKSLAASFYESISHFLAARLRKVTASLISLKTIRHHL
ncbi:MAG: cyclic nucleotide-binding domain-containing protein [Leptospiraceae bacterium]|nr:cyclic nucleotide-binding domain-containing protein [Leptospiraceae bacterium]